MELFNAPDFPEENGSSMSSCSESQQNHDNQPESLCFEWDDYKVSVSIFEDSIEY